MAYVYRFKDIEENVIYIGYTGGELATRINQHWTKGHLPTKCYNSVAKIEYQFYKTKADAQIAEVIFINKYKPIYNKLNKQNDRITFDLGEEKTWKLYKILRVKSKANTTSNKKTNRILALIYIVIIFLIYYFLM